MASFKQNPGQEHCPGHYDVVSSTPRLEVMCHWDDVTNAVNTASASMKVGEIIHGESFSLFTAMSAMELMDPRMDTGCGAIKNVREVLLPSTLSDLQVVNIMDQLMACLMSWLDAHTLPQTVFSCVYAQRLTDIPRPELFSFLRIQLAIMDMIVNIISEERVAEEEDFISWTFGFRLRPLRHGDRAGDSQILENMLNEVREYCEKTEGRDPVLAHGIFVRVQFWAQFYRTMQYLTISKLSGSTTQASKLLNELRELASAWEECSRKQPVDQDFIYHIFDASINRHLITSAPPRTAPLLSVPSGFKYLHELITEFVAVVNLRQLALPNGSGLTGEGSDNIRRYSLHVAIHAVEGFCAEHKPKVLTRSLLSMLMVPEQSLSLFGNYDANFCDMISTDMGLHNKFEAAMFLAPAKRFGDGILQIFKCMCRNRSRQRRQLVHVLRWLDHYSKFSFPTDGSKQSSGVNPLSGVLAQFSVNGARHDHMEARMTDAVRISPGQEEVDHFERKTPIEVVSYELSARLIIQHLLLGFEIDLYQEYEYAAVFFYVGYTLTAMSHATASFSKPGRRQALSHPLRLALYLVDEARLWLCRALYSTLEALSSGDEWDYSCNRAKQHSESAPWVFGSEEIWYEQRFGIISGLRNGPAYADYSSFTAFKAMQYESLQSDEKGKPVILLRLREAASGFLAARRKAEKAKRVAEQCPKNMVTREILQIARVAIENSLVVSKLLRSYENKTEHRSLRKYRVSFKFSRHPHFPVLEVTEREQS